MAEIAASKQLPQGIGTAVGPEIAPEESDLEQNPEVPTDTGSQYTGRLEFVLLTTGLMAVVFIIALDNYIIGP
jgi:hypothetical protein